MLAMSGMECMMVCTTICRPRSALMLHGEGHDAVCNERHFKVPNPRLKCPTTAARVNESSN